MFLRWVASGNAGFQIKYDPRSQGGAISGGGWAEDPLSCTKPFHHFQIKYDSRSLQIKYTPVSSPAVSQPIMEYTNTIYSCY